MRIYTKRSIIISIWLIVTMPYIGSASVENEWVIQSNQSSHYPPYPDVWEREVPLLDQGFSVHRFFFLGNGDVLLVYPSKYFPSTSSFVFNSIGFFGGSVSFDVDLFKIVEVFNSQGIGAPQLKLSNDRMISLQNLDQRMIYRCPQELNHYYRVEGPNGKARTVSVLYKLASPRKIEINDRCATTNEESYEVKVLSLQGNIIPLADGGFLLSDPSAGLVVRFDDTFSSKSTLVGTSVLIVDTDALVTIGVNQFEGMSYQRIQDQVLSMFGSAK